jgi:hypothetical protein
VGAGIQPSRRRWGRAGAHELWQFLGLMAFVAFFRAWISSVPFTALGTRGFSRRTATAMGIAARVVPVLDGLFVRFARTDPPRAMAARSVPSRRQLVPPTRAPCCRSLTRDAEANGLLADGAHVCTVSTRDR